MASFKNTANNLETLLTAEEFVDENSKQIEFISAERKIKLFQSTCKCFYIQQNKAEFIVRCYGNNTVGRCGFTPHYLRLMNGNKY